MKRIAGQWMLFTEIKGIVGSLILNLRISLLEQFLQDRQIMDVKERGLHTNVFFPKTSRQRTQAKFSFKAKIQGEFRCHFINFFFYKMIYQKDF